MCIFFTDAQVSTGCGKGEILDHDGGEYSEDYKLRELLLSTSLSVIVVISSYKLLSGARKL